MQNALRIAFFALAVLLPGVAFGQCSFPTGLAPNTIVGRLGVTPGPCQAIPFATLSSKLTGASITLNSGNGQTAPGAMSGGNTYSFGATTDTPQFTGIGVGGTAPATGITVYNNTATPSGNGQGMMGGGTVSGGTLLGQGSTYDASIANKSGSIALGVPTGTQSLVMPTPATVGTVAGSMCMTSGGLVLYEVAVNCFTVSGISVTAGKTLTVTNTITLSGTDGTTFTFPGSSDTVATLGQTQTFTGNKTFSGTVNFTGTPEINGTAFGTFATQNFATPPAIGGTTPAAGAFTTLTATTPVAVASGGTNASTAAGARSSTGINVEGLTSHGDSIYQILATDRTVGTSTTLTASRTWTLPAASAVNPGHRLVVADFAGGVTGTNTLVVQRAGSDTVNGATSATINTTNGAYLFISNGVSAWTAQALGASATTGVSTVNGQNGAVSIVAGQGVGVSTAGGNVTVSSNVLLTGVVLAKTANYTVASGDAGSTITLGGSAQFTLTINAASGYPSNAGFLITNLASETSSKTLAINGLTVRNIYPGESLIVSNQSNTWAVAPQLGRYKAPGAMGFFVRPDGSDTVCDGLTNAAASGASGQACAFLTANACMNNIAQNIDINNQAVAVGCRHTCASPPCTFTNNTQFLSLTGGTTFVGGSPYYKGDTTTPTNAKFNPSGATTADIMITLEPNSVPILIGGFEFAGGANVSYGVYCGGSSNCDMYAAWQCDAMSATASTGFPAGACLEVNSGARLYLNANFAVTGSIGAVLSETNQAYMEVGSAITATISGSLTWANGFYYGVFGGTGAVGSITFSGAGAGTNSAGPGCNVAYGSTINKNAAGAGYFPGTANCSVAGGGVSSTSGSQGFVF